MREGIEEIGSGSDPFGAGLHEAFDGAGEGMGGAIGREGGEDGGLRETEGGLRGGDPGGGIGETRERVQFDSREMFEGGGEGGTQSSDQLRVEFMKARAEAGLGAALLGGDLGKLDEDGAAGEFGVEGEAAGRGEDDGTLGGTERLRLPARDGGDMVEGQDAVVRGESLDLTRRIGKGRERRGGWVDGVAQQAGGGGFAAGGGALQDQDGIRSGGFEGGGEPAQATLAGVRGDGEKLLEELVEGTGAGGRLRERAGLFGVAKARLEVGLEGPALGGDLDGFALGVGEVEVQGVGEKGRTVGGDAEVDGAAGKGAALGLGDEGVEGIADG